MKNFKVKKSKKQRRYWAGRMVAYQMLRCAQRAATKILQDMLKHSKLKNEVSEIVLLNIERNIAQIIYLELRSEETRKDFIEAMNWAEAKDKSNFVWR